MPNPKHTTSDRMREELHELSAGFREVAAALGVPAGIPPEEEEEHELVDPEEIRESIIGRAVAGSENAAERFKTPALYTDRVNNLVRRDGGRR